MYTRMSHFELDIFRQGKNVRMQISARSSLEGMETNRICVHSLPHAADASISMGFFSTVWKLATQSSGRHQKRPFRKTRFTLRWTEGGWATYGPPQTGPTPWGTRPLTWGRSTRSRGDITGTESFFSSFFSSFLRERRNVSPVLRCLFCADVWRDIKIEYSLEIYDQVFCGDIWWYYMMRGYVSAHFWVMSQQRQNSWKDNFGSSNARVSGRDFLYSLQVLFLDTVEETDWQEQLIS